MKNGTIIHSRNLDFEELNTEIDFEPNEDMKPVEEKSEESFAEVSSPIP